MKTFLAGILCGAAFAVVLLGFSQAGAVAFAQDDEAAPVFTGISNSTAGSNTRAITESGDVYELARRRIKEGDKVLYQYYWAKEVNIVADEKEYEGKKADAS